MNESTYKKSLEQLNPEQKEAVTHIDGPVAVKAGPGTGKTQILTLRIAHIISELGADMADSILALTFTNSAVRGMKERLAFFTDYETAYRVPIFTFHSFAQHVIQAYPEYFQVEHDFRISSDIERIELLEKIIDEADFGALKPKYNNYMYLKDIMFGIDKIKNEGLDPDQYLEQIHKRHEQALASDEIRYKKKYRGYEAGDIKPKELVKLEKRKEKNIALVDIYRTYQETLKKNKLFDYSDLLLIVLRELDTNSEFKQQLQEEYQYILVDEHQDTNDGQNRLLFHLIDNPVWEGKPNIFTVGDGKQSIFRFAGATEASFEILNSALPETKIIELKTNYRSGQHVLDQAYKTIAESEHHAQEVALNSFFKHDGVIELRNFSNYKYELLFIAKQIQNKIEKGEDPNEMAVLYRNNTYGADVRRILDVFGIPYKDYSKKNLLDNSYIMKLLLLMQSIESLHADEQLAQLLYSDFIKIHPYSVSKILQKRNNNRKETRKNIYSIISDRKVLAEIEIPKDEIEICVIFSEFLAQAHARSKQEEFVQIFPYVIRDSGFLSYVITLSDSATVLQAIEKLYDEGKREGFVRDSYKLTDFISYIRAMKEHQLSIEIPTEHRDGVSLMTFHGSKGLEFEDVYIYKAVESRSPGGKLTLALDVFKDSIEDERRLFFVALTRAKKNLYLSTPGVDYQEKEKSLLSFIKEQELITEIDVTDFEKEITFPVVEFMAEPQDFSLSLIDPTYVREKFLKSSLSVSALNNYIESPILYYFRNLVRLPEAKSDTLEYGSFIHEVLEYFFKESQKTKEIGAIDDMERVINQVIQEHPKWERYKKDGSILLTDYYEERKEHMRVPLETEYPVYGFKLALENDINLLLTGKIDKIEQNEKGDIVIIDYKTGRSLSDMTGSDKKKRQEKTIRQAVFYALLLDTYRAGKYRSRTVVFDYVERAESKEYEPYTVHVTDVQIDELKQEIQDMVDSIISGRFLQELYSSQDIPDHYKDLFRVILDSKE